MSAFEIKELPGAVGFAVKVQPRAKRDRVIGELGDAIKIALKAPAVDGRANQACIEFLANLLKVPRASITITSGQLSRRKAVRVQGVTAAQARERLAPSK